MAVVNEMLEAELTPRIVQLVGTDGLAHRRAGAVGLETAQNQRAEFHLAAVYVRLRLARRMDGQDGQDLRRQTAENQIAQRTAGNHTPEPTATFARRLRRSAGRMEASQAVAGPES